MPMYLEISSEIPVSHFVDLEVSGSIPEGGTIPLLFTNKTDIRAPYGRWPDAPKQSLDGSILENVDGALRR